MRKQPALRSAAIGLAGLTMVAMAPLAAQADEIISRSGHKTCPVGQQVRVWSLANGDTVEQNWYSDNGTYGGDTRHPGIAPEDTQTFTLQRDVSIGGSAPRASVHRS